MSASDMKKINVPLHVLSRLFSPLVAARFESPLNERFLSPEISTSVLSKIKIILCSELVFVELSVCQTVMMQPSYFIEIWKKS